jgi:hypothetical protein
MPLGPCYLCRTKNVLVERDHLPPKNLFEEPRPSNLITCPICLSCHKNTHEDDEAFRVFTTGYVTRNEAAASLWENKVVPRTLERGRIQPFLNRLRKTAEPAVVSIGQLHLPVMKFGVDRAPINRVLTRITRGLFSTFAPHIDARELCFRINMIDPFQLPARLSFASQILNHLSRGKDVYDCWWGFDEAEARTGLWVHMFFRSVAFAVRHRAAVRRPRL